MLLKFFRWTCHKVNKYFFLRLDGFNVNKSVIVNIKHGLLMGHLDPSEYMNAYFADFHVCTVDTVYIVDDWTSLFNMLQPLVLARFLTDHCLVN